MHVWFSAFLTLSLLHLLAVISPGPDFAIVVKNSLLYDKRSAVYTALGVALGVLVHVTYCVLGFAVIISQSIWLFNIIKYLGAAYLIYIGIKGLLSREKKEIEVSSQPEKLNIKKLQIFAAIKQGFFCNALNPKASLFFLGLFTLVVKPQTPFMIQVLYGLWMAFVTFAWFASLACMITHPRMRQRVFSIQPLINRVLGGFLVLFGVRLIFMQR